VTGRTERGKNRQDTYARGFRNLFRMAFDPDTPVLTTRFFINDVGGNRLEEIDEGKAGADYGWNLCEGRRDNPYRGGRVRCSGGGRTLPVHAYSHNTGCRSITGGAFVPDDGSWPAEYDDSYLVGDFVCNKIFELSPDERGGFSRTVFTKAGDGGPIAKSFGPSRPKDPYYTTFANGG